MAKLYEIREWFKRLISKKTDIVNHLDGWADRTKEKLSASREEYEGLTGRKIHSAVTANDDSMNVIIEVVYATNNTQIINEVQLAQGATIEEGIRESGLLDKCTDVDLTKNKVGIYGAVKPLTTMVANGDRIEIYRPVTADATKQ